MHRKILLALLLPLLPLAGFFLAPSARASTTTIINVNSTLDVIADDGNCTLREAVIAANTDIASGAAANECPAGSGADTIVLPAGTYTITYPGFNEEKSLTGDFDITQTVTIRGAGYTCGSPNPNCTLLKGDSLDRIFDVTTTIQVTISQMEIQGGNPGSSVGGGIRNYGGLTLNQMLFVANSSQSGGGLSNAYGASAMLDNVIFVSNISSGNGGAIYNRGTLTFTTGALSYDTATFNGGGLYNDLDGSVRLTGVTIANETATLSRGGGIFHNGPAMALNQVTLSNNVALNGNGAGIYISSDGGGASLTNVTLSANSAVSSTSQGGAIFAQPTDGATLTNVTIYGNTAATGGGIYRDPAAGTISVKNTIVYSNTTGNCAGGLFNSLGYNLEGANTCAFSATGDLTTTNPLLIPLASNGGFVQTHALPVASPAINKIPFGTNGCGTTITTDARGYARVAPCDIGAFEYVLRLFLPLIKR